MLKKSWLADHLAWKQEKKSVAIMLELPYF